MTPSRISDDNFVAPRYLSNPWAQTLLARMLPQGTGEPPKQRATIRLPDGDRLAVAVDPASPAQMATPHAGTPEGPGVAVLIHGLCGSEDSPYMRRVGRRLTQFGHHCVRVNLRGCGPGMGLARLPYHSGQGRDAQAVLDWVGTQFPGLPITLIGFSLGANLVLDLAAEHGGGRLAASPGMAALRSVVAVSPPLDLSASADKIDGLGLVQRRFLDELHTHTQALHRHFPDTSPPPARATSLRGFDDAYTAPRSGYRDASDYYARASSGPRLAEIRVPTKLICAQDDPVIDTSALTGVPSHAALHVRVTQHGGHVGFVGRSRNVFGRWWVDERICAWIAARERDGFDPNTEREAP